MTNGSLIQPTERHLPIFPRLVVTHLQTVGFSKSDIFEGLDFSSLDLEREAFRLDADDLAPMAAMLCSELSRFIVGQNIVIDGGQHASIF